MNERMIDLKKQELMNEILGDSIAIHSRSVCNGAWNAATKACLAIALETLCEALINEKSELTYGAAREIQILLHRELDL